MSAHTAPAVPASFPDLSAVAAHLREVLTDKRFVVLYAYNGTGKTRLSTEFKTIGKQRDATGEVVDQDTLYFNAYTEDLFSWDNDLENDAERVLQLNNLSSFFDGLRDYSMDVKIGKLLERYADFDFRIMLERRESLGPPETSELVLPPAVLFFRERDKDNARSPSRFHEAKRICSSGVSFSRSSNGDEPGSSQPRCPAPNRGGLRRRMSGSSTSTLMTPSRR
jgi:hypothetical protein